MSTIPVRFEDCIRIDGNLYMIDMGFNAIYRMVIKTGEIEIVASLPEENLLERRLGAKIVHHNGSLYFAPMNADKIWRWNISTNTWKSYDREKLGNSPLHKQMFQAVLYKDKIFFIGSLYPAIIVLDTVIDQLVYIKEPYQHIYPKAQKAKDACFRCDYVVIDNILYLASCVSNEVLKLDLDTYESEFVTVGGDNFSYSGIGYDGCEFYLAPRKRTPIVIWDGMKEEQLIELPEIYNGNNDEPVFGGVCCENDRVIFPACFWDKSLIISKTNDIIELKIEEKSYYFYKKIDSTTTVCLEKPNILTIMCDDEKFRYETVIDSEKMKQLVNFSENCPLESITKEDMFATLDLFLEVIKK